MLIPQNSDSPTQITFLKTHSVSSTKKPVAMQWMKEITSFQERFIFDALWGNLFSKYRPIFVTLGLQEQLKKKGFLAPFKGQLISKCPFGVIVWTNLPPKNRPWQRRLDKRIYRTKKWGSGLFWAAEKQPPECHKYATFWGGFFQVFVGKEHFWIF